jgi:hypothetical protein
MNDVPPSNIWLAIAKEWYWIVIFAALVLVAFAPSFLKGKCPACKRRSLKSIDVHPEMLAGIDGIDAAQYPSFFSCSACGARFKRFRSGPLQDASQPELEKLFVAVPSQD